MRQNIEIIMTELDYKDSLFLPKTDFPMRAGLPKREPEWLARWNKIGIYDRCQEKPGREIFVLHDGPPYANGHLHIGHALNKILKDMIVRSQQMLGKNARYIPGWDCHGLPIEWKIEEQYRKKGKNKDEVPIIDFRAQCREFAAEWIEIQKSEFQRLGITGKWDKPYLTMDFHAERVIAEEFMKFLMNGTLYQGSKPVMWSPVEKTALAEAEVEYHDKESFTIWVKFKVTKSDTDLNDAYVVIWTTTPWTIPSNKAVVFGADIDYGLYEVIDTPEESWVKKGERFILADKLADDVMKKARLEEGMYRKIRAVEHSEFAPIALLHPLYQAKDSAGEWDDARDFSAADFVTDTEGTGFVHCAPSHGMEEFELFRDLGMLEQVITYNVMEDGRLRADMPFFGGKAILKPNGKEGNANSAIIEKLAEVGGLIARGKIQHSYPHSWRSKAPVIYRNTPQWFAAIDKPVNDGHDRYGKTIRERALTSIDELVTWTPKTGRNRLYSMIEARPDWVLSRQRAWGVPLTCFIKAGAMPTDPDFLLRNEEVNARIIAAFEAEGADAWYHDDAKSRFLTGIVNPEDYVQVKDILDVWFDSGSTHAFVLRDREDGAKDGIADLYLEGTDQHRGWFHSSMLQACGTMGRAPYRGVLTHGFTLDEKGMKMSKSLGNTVSPDDVVQQYGADILRLWVAGADYTSDSRIGPEILKGVADLYRRLRNSFRFMLGALGDEQNFAKPDELPALEAWVLHRLSELDTKIRTSYQSYAFSEALHEIINFATIDLSSYYFDIRKDCLYCDPQSSHERQATLYVINEVYNRLTRWLAPVLVFTMEEVWLARNPSDSDSVHLQDFLDTPSTWRNPQLAENMARIRKIRRVVTGAIEVERTKKVIGSSLEAAPIVYLSPDDAKLVQSLPFEEIAITSAIEISTDAAPDGAFSIEDLADVKVVFKKADGEKCERCWRVLEETGTGQHEKTCLRCDKALTERS